MTKAPPAKRPRWKKIYLRVPLIYAGIGVLWILFSDRVLLLIVEDTEELTRLQIFKGWFYVGVTALLLYLLLRREVRKLEASHRALAKSEAKFKAIFNQTFQFLGLLTPEGKTIAANDTALNFAGSEADKVFGKPFWETPWWTHSAAVQEQIQHAIQRASEGQFVRFETTNIGEQGEIIDIDFSLKPVYGRQGEVLYLIPEGRDITERKRTESELSAYRTHLEELVEERTLDLKNAQEELLRKEKLATLGRLTSTVSHELRNPLGSIRNAIYTLDQSIAEVQRTEQIERSFQFAERNIQRCVMVIDQLLDFATEKQLYFEETDLDSFLAKCADSWPKPAEVLLTTQFESGAKVNLDRHQMGLVLEKLFANAVESFEVGTESMREIQVASKRVDNAVEIAIRDTGPGIPEPILEKVHEPLFSTKGFGVGLGIPYAHDIVGKHGGVVTIESREDLGTTATIRLPLS
ncbi:MAG: PAS domain S-box protein [Candidatus Omnitrophica bacterium]|nr:PAS domain S-box protein [Candidatus Omnitrophota bacterium]